MTPSFNSPSYRYILRYQIDPDFHAAARLEELASFCVEAKVEEVMLLTSAEELSTGHVTGEEWARWIDLACRVRDRLAREGVALSLNPWTTTYQVPRGRKLRAGQDFELMVGETGKANGITACPLCPAWQEYLATSFARLAAEVRPVAIWIEDDWRLHNHGGDLGWGGCFCERHMARFSAWVGERVERERLLEALLQPGEPHPWRAEWLALSRETLLEPMHVVRQAVRAANEETELGLMSSRPDQHSVEGRDWPSMQAAVAGEGRFLIRPHMEPYTEERALRVTASVTRQTLACLSGDAVIYPELENSPRCGVYSKSGRHTVWQMMEAAVLGAPGITINHYDNLGNGVGLDRRFGGHLAGAKPLLNALAALGLDDRRADGVQVLVSPRVASHLHLPVRRGGATGAIDGAALAEQMSRNPSGAGAEGYAGSMQSLVHPSPVWGETMAILGLAHRFTTAIEPGRGPILVNGQTLRAFDDEALRRLLGGYVLLDAVAAQVLQERGFGDALGVRVGRGRTQEETAMSYEQLNEDDPQVHGHARPRLCAQRCATRWHELEMAAGACELTTLCNAQHERLGAGVVDYRNAWGGRVVVLAQPIDGSAQFFMAFFNTYRRKFFEGLFAGAEKCAFGADGTRVYRQETDEGLFIAVLNASLDALDEVGLRLGGEAQDTQDRAWRYLDEAGRWAGIQPAADGSGWLRFPLQVPALRGAFLLGTA